MPTPQPALVPHVTTRPSPAVRLRALSKVHGRGANAVTALHEVSHDFPEGTFTAVMGPSGSGKSTLMHCAAGLEPPTSGGVMIGGRDIAGWSERRLTRLRRTRIGFVFQEFNLVPALNVADNVALPLRLAGRRPDSARLADLLSRVGLADRRRHRPAELSGGQQQRVAVARALVAQPEVVFADEPTGALDRASGRDVLALLRDAVDGLGTTVVMVTHDPQAAAWADEVLVLADGRLADRLTGKSVTPDTIAARLAAVGS
ncbi:MULTISPECIES: ABC transporter ATP-binding protein [Streptomyces]|uniref:ABC transporter ATP-binding protein n=1 Tax=Streptomyces TaxID=1883 RepID=UPI000629140B|nr:MULTISPECIES: ABC transporter ATP-binding protein [Streptomyces]MBP5862083.1 ABC transporter ATP-binding protein [Streptomyces sp. LBUM 1484]MBP5868966.1 ABC transporter ATP-binding protein [Streptomyces sp. LBUM 1485]MBP5907476.1 ABC transporter ATP-binding protein [Streptomyces sp. LBUM 1478]MBP5929641.1 ABC transporter ATP-binding protein [Streptomyces sp. LBUM 1479]QTU47691.1 ABC transporter ATP-binding protein [Streptomyces sp. LBUM 1482]QTU55508.1 ABC transporter ATP-binding protein 